MVKIGRWLAIVLLGLGGAGQIAVGIAYLAGWKKVPELEEMPVPPGQEGLIVGIAGVVTILVGAVLALTSWGLYNWRPWARVIAIVLCLLNLFSLVFLSFATVLQAEVIVSGVLFVALLLWLFDPGVQAAFAARREKAE